MGVGVEDVYMVFFTVQTFVELFEILRLGFFREVLRIFQGE